ncbi:hypothetical protein [Streptomyces sp. NPDC050121]|uniref:hypothetical protein n=1 Tax=Streptomyces sp. NPDC050121 TaxID=3365601 RepID=UPI0037A4600A
MNTTSSVVPTAWMREHTTLLTTIDPAAGLDDLEPLRRIVGDARVVAIGEGAHFVEELSTVRQRVMRFLAGGLMAWLREQNATSGNPLRFVGVDVPEAGGALRPVLAQLPSARRIR